MTHDAQCRSRGFRPPKGALLLAAVLAALLVACAPASARIGIKSLSAETLGPDATQAGGHPDVRTTFQITRLPTGGALGNGPHPIETMRDLRAELPAGLAGSAVATPTCTEAQLSVTACPPDAQVGLLSIWFADPDDPNASPPQDLAVYNLAPPRGQVAEFGYNIFGLVSGTIRIRVRDESDYGLEALLKGLATESIPAFFGARLTLWGVPADPSHDPDRFATGAFSGPATSGATPAALLTNPTSCGTAPASVDFAMDSYESPGDWATGSAPVPAMTGCDRLAFAPRLTLQPSFAQAGEPSGYDVDLTVPQPDGPSTLGTANVRDVSVTLPEGAAISPSAAQGLVGCTDAQAGFGSTADPACPDAAKIGTASIETPLLGDALDGTIYLARPTPGRLFRIFVISQADGVVVRLAGDITPDPKTGQLTATFKDNPQLPFGKLALHFQGGAHAPLVNPPTCGPKTTTWSITSWGGQHVEGNDTYNITSAPDGVPCGASPFRPGFSAGSSDDQAGHSGTFSVAFSRGDADQRLGAISVQLPPGVLGRIGAVAQCPEAQAAAGTCDAASQIGTATTTAGAGSSPYALPGRVYLTGPYKGAPFGLSIVVPALAGPFDLGTVVVRASIAVDPQTAALRITSDPLPTILDGVPLDLRSETLSIDRAGFMINPTNCDPLRITAALTSAAGAAATVGTPFQANGCSGLGYAPPLALALSGAARRNGHPALTAHLAPVAGQANTKAIAVGLPMGVSVDLKNLQHLCAPEKAAINACPADSIVGHAQARSILPHTLQAPVYIVQGTRKDPRTGRVISTLPRLFMPLTADGTTIDVSASSTLAHGRLVASFDGLPDVPLQSFDLTLNGGAKGILTYANDPCATTQQASETLDGQNGARVARTVVVPAGCSLRVLGAAVAGSKLAVKLTGLGAGRVTVAGRGLQKAGRRLASSTTATVAVPVSRSLLAQLRHRAARLPVSVTFAPAGGRSRTIHPTIKIPRR